MTPRRDEIEPNETPIPKSGIARLAFAGTLAALGGLLLAGVFVYVWAPFPKWVPGRELLAQVSGALILLSAVGLSWRRTVAAASASVALLFLGWLLCVQVPRIIGAPTKEGLWAGGAQIATIVAAGWILFASFASPIDGPARGLRGTRVIRIARSLYAVALPFFGLHHFVDLAGSAEAVPAWLPFRMSWAFLTGIAHVAAGLAILVGIVPRLAARLEAIMVGAFVVLVHVPGVIGAPKDPLQWTMLIVAAAIGGAGWVVASSYDTPLEK